MRCGQREITEPNGLKYDRVYNRNSISIVVVDKCRRREDVLLFSRGKANPVWAKSGFTDAVPAEVVGP